MADSPQNIPPEGRLDILLFRIATRCTNLLEAKYNLAGLSEQLTPLLEKQISELIPQKWVKVPDEVLALCKLLYMNREQVQAFLQSQIKGKVC